MGWKGIVGISNTAEDFDKYCHGVQSTAWRPSSSRCTTRARRHSFSARRASPSSISSTSNPTIVMTRNGAPVRILFVDDKQIWVFTPLNLSGVHSPSWNKIAMGVEMLGDYSKEKFDSGRGLKVQQNAVGCRRDTLGRAGTRPRNNEATQGRSCDRPRLSRQERQQGRLYSSRQEPHGRTARRRASGKCTNVRKQSRARTSKQGEELVVRGGESVDSGDTTHHQTTGLIGIVLLQRFLKLQSPIDEVSTGNSRSPLPGSWRLLGCRSVASQVQAACSSSCSSLGR